MGDDGICITSEASITMRRRRRREYSGDDETMLDGMLEELGIPNSAEKRRQQAQGNAREEVIELITPPRPERRLSPRRANSGAITLDLTTPTPPLALRDRAQPTGRRRSRESVVDLLSSDDDEDDDPEPDKSPAASNSESEDEAMIRELMQGGPQRRATFDEQQPLSVRMRVKRRLHDSDQEEGTETTYRPPVSSLHVESTIHADMDSELDEAPQRKRKKRAPKPSKAKKQVVSVAVAMEKALGSSDTGDLITKALEQNSYNNKPIPFELGAVFDCAFRVIQFERRGRDMREGESEPDRFAIAVHYPAEAFLNLVLDRGYDALVKLTKRLCEVPCHTTSQGSGVEWGYRVVIIEGADRALINRKKASGGRNGRGQNQSAQAREEAISFSELHELAFRLFMDTGAHTKFTCDSDATASYVALLTRELIVAAVKPSPQEEFLESVPRVHAFRVLPSDGSTLNVFANTWLRMLQMIPAVSEDRAQRILDHFPTFQSLLSAYNDPTRPDQDKQELLADKFNGMRYEPAISRRIHRVFSSINSNASA